MVAVAFALLPQRMLLFMRADGGGVLPANRSAAFGRQPHIHGARSGQYRSGISVANTKSAPPWEPGMAHENTQPPYTADEYFRDVRPWVQATEVDERRRGPLLKPAIGCQARLYLEELENREGPDIYVVGRVNADGVQESGPLVICKLLMENPRECGDDDVEVWTWVLQLRAKSRRRQ